MKFLVKHFYGGGGLDTYHVECDRVPTEEEVAERVNGIVAGTVDLSRDYLSILRMKSDYWLYIE